jgi:hypothetical protein
MEKYYILSTEFGLKYSFLNIALHPKLCDPKLSGNEPVSGPFKLVGL